MKPITLGQVIADLLAEKAYAGISAARLAALRITLGGFAKGREQQTISSVTKSEVGAYLRTKNRASYKTLRSNISTLFGYAVRQGHVTSNPCALLESIQVAAVPIAFLTRAQVLTCIEALCEVRASSRAGLPPITYRHALPWFVLTALCGLRPDEARQVTAALIDLEEGWIRVDQGKMARRTGRRVVYPLPEALALLRASLPGGRLPLSVESKKRVIKFLRGRLGMDVWIKDLTRHTAATYWLAISRSAKDCAESLGNSERVLQRDYKALATIKEAQAFWTAMAEKAEALTSQPTLILFPEPEALLHG